MSKSKDLNKSAIMNDINKYLQTLGKTLTKNAADQYTADAKASIEEFYLDYRPKAYNRTFDLLHNSYYRFYKNHTTKFYGGVIVSSKRMSDYINNYRLLSNNRSITPKQDVFRWTWLEGFHGYNWELENNERIITPIQTEPPISKLLERFNDKAKYNDMIKNALSEARKGNYKFLKFSNEG